jgi:hypothetical protein
MISEELPEERHLLAFLSSNDPEAVRAAFSTSRRRGIRSKAQRNKPAGKSLLSATLLHHLTAASSAGWRPARPQALGLGLV